MRNRRRINPKLKRAGKAQYDKLVSNSYCNIASLIVNKSGESLDVKKKRMLKKFYKDDLDEIQTYGNIDSAVEYMNTLHVDDLKNIRNKIKAELQYSEKTHATYVPSMNMLNVITILVALFVLISDIIFNNHNLLWEKGIVIAGSYILMLIITGGNKKDMYVASKYQLITKFLTYLYEEIDDIINQKESEDVILRYDCKITNKKY